MRGVVLGLVASLVLSGATSRSTAAPFAAATAPYEFHFPADHGAHPNYQSEWWYFSGHLRAGDGRSFGYELTFFRVRFRPEELDPTPAVARSGHGSRWRGDQIYPAHFAITDVAGKKFVHSERLAREALGLGSAAIGRLEIHAADWSLQGVPLSDRALERMTLHAGDALNRIDFVETPLKPPAIHGRHGILRMGACRTCASHYYSYTRLRTRGTLTYQGRRLSVEGTSWMDHVFGTAMLDSEEVGWDWVALQLDDGRDLMVLTFRRRNGEIDPASAGTIAERKGRVRALRMTDFSLSATGRWRSPVTQTDYPTRWRVHVPSARIDGVLTPSVQGQEMTLKSGAPYWEGDVEVRDATTSRPLGRGYVELTGYAEPVVL